MYILSIHICIHILDRPVHTCAYTCAFALISPPDATEVGCTVPTSGPLPRQPKLTLGFHVILFVDTACFQTVFPNSFPKPFWKRIMETVFLTGITTENPGFPTGIPLETPFPECVSKMFLETMLETLFGNTLCLQTK